LSTSPPPGLGDCMVPEQRLDALLGAALMSIPAVKGVEIGSGFKLAAATGSKAADEIHFKPGKKSGPGFYRLTNNAGGIEGGMTNGEPLILRAVVKPIPTLMNPLNTVDVETLKPVKAQVERSDVCAVSAASVIGQAVAGLVLARAALEKFGGDSLKDFVSNWRGYLRRISGK
jgi:chorismate synthase